MDRINNRVSAATPFTMRCWRNTKIFGAKATSSHSLGDLEDGLLTLRLYPIRGVLLRTSRTTPATIHPPKFFPQRSYLKLGSLKHRILDRRKQKLSSLTVLAATILHDEPLSIHQCLAQQDLSHLSAKASNAEVKVIIGHIRHNNSGWIHHVISYRRQSISLSSLEIYVTPIKATSGSMINSSSFVRLVYRVYFLRGIPPWRIASSPLGDFA